MREVLVAIGVGFLLAGCAKSNRECVTHECEVQTDNPGYAKLPETNVQNCTAAMGLKVQEQWGIDPSNEFMRRCGKMMGH